MHTSPCLLYMGKGYRKIYRWFSTNFMGGPKASGWVNPLWPRHYVVKMWCTVASSILCYAMFWHFLWRCMIHKHLIIVNGPAGCAGSQPRTGLGSSQDIMCRPACRKSRRCQPAMSAAAVCQSLNLVHISQTGEKWTEPDWRCEDKCSQWMSRPRDWFRRTQVSK